MDSTNDDNDNDDSKIFPQRLMEILNDTLYEESICWLPHGRAFVICNRSLFAEQVMPRFFTRRAKYSSFTRKLNRWYVCCMMADGSYCCFSMLFDYGIRFKR
jgi:hypothetical protein